ncbi:UDP-N-acetylmuramoyl-tripeptide--D-alanyl-D-alanine ligase [Roseateles oligotrophus]|uniref:UDP-N-acetylmuramoyl-tripeptide--D-alanyl-D-alanine ligase n=1 Tax=Roseateles oligotrophus TaxID=1769250 RepID=A0ABT2YEC0_9BURK|nr:UDP-N-acetylmuramoyl-tripeptide--D-alanyl-D-alanine ligase [Roseateles oligotrophus]MCV2368374.1 UDP-N-acetylmuramoyl-tripeptide--D-alanyl-D-alanine ligase [Roseateles oligotrophus]
MTLAQAHALLLSAVPQAQLVGDGSVAIARVHSDSRSLEAGDLFVALRGERFDAHDFLPQAAAAGAVAALAERGLLEAGLSGILVPDAKAALGHLAAAWRAQLQLPLIAVTGSNGKTTVTQMIASILRAWVGNAALATVGNFNNDIGVPLTLLRLRQDDSQWIRVAVIELGMNHPGEIAPLAQMAAPSVALVNNAQREHQEFMQTVEAAARENGAVIESLGATGVAVFPAEDACAPIWYAMAGARPHLSFALQGEADVTGRATWVEAAPVGHWALELHTPAGDAPIALAVAGLHNVRNAMAAAACALAAGAPLAAIVRGLEEFEPVKGRSQLKSCMQGERRVTLIDDSYNANPDSVRAAIDVLAGLPGRSWLLLGDMGEVGDQGPAFHREVGAYAAARGIANLWTAGVAAADASAAFGPAARHFNNTADLISAMQTAPAELPAVDNILVKGSRFMQMERVVGTLQTQAGASDAA